MSDIGSIDRELNRLEVSAPKESTPRDNKTTGSVFRQRYRFEICTTIEDIIVKTIYMIGIEIHSVLKYNRFETTTDKVTPIIVIGTISECIFTNYFQTFWQSN